MEMGYGLSPIGAGVDDNAVAVAESGLFCNILNSQQQVTHEVTILRIGIGKLGNRLLGNHEDVNWGLGLNIFKGKYQVILIHNVSGDFTTDNLAEDGFCGFTHVAWLFR
jgi:hypothetical protein